jgi:tetratricopeptide (TPR) repeat protein
MDWIDEALAAGQGFKSEEEKQAYVASLGDPLDHPMFCTDPTKLASHPLAGAIRAIKEEDKSNLELASMYKEEGNQWIKHKDNVKDMHAAYDQYSYALEFIEKAIKELSEHPDKYDRIEIRQLQSILYSNRALASLNLKNYGECIKDSTASISINPSNIKAYYRKCKALVSLRRFTECVTACDEAFVLENNTEIAAVKAQCLEGLARIKQAEDARLLETKKLLREVTLSYNIAKKNKVSFWSIRIHHVIVRSCDVTRWPCEPQRYRCLRSSRGAVLALPMTRRRCAGR